MERYRIVGFFDEHYKWAGQKQIIKFRPEDQFITEKVPTPSELNEYVKRKGYKIKGWRHKQDEANPIYKVIFDA